MRKGMTARMYNAILILVAVLCIIIIIASATGAIRLITESNREELALKQATAKTETVLDEVQRQLDAEIGRSKDLSAKFDKLSKEIADVLQEVEAQNDNHELVMTSLNIINQNQMKLIESISENWLKVE